MSSRFLICLQIVFVLILTACSIKVNDEGSSNALESTDIIIPPDSSLAIESNSNLRNIGANNLYQQNVVNKLYDNMGKDHKLLDFDVDEKRIYTLISKEKTFNGSAAGNTINLYDIESGKPLNSFSLSNIKNSTAIAVMGEELYTYDYSSGNIFAVSFDGMITKTISSGFKELTVEKMRVDDTKRIYLIASDELNPNDRSIYVIDQGHASYVIDKNKLLQSLNYTKEQLKQPNIHIEDFCLNDSKSMLIRVFPERICSFNIETKKVEKVSYIPDSANFISYDSSILYYASAMKVIFSSNLANYSNDGSQNYVGRILLNENFPWSIDASSLSDFRLGDIMIPYTEHNMQHIKMSQNNKYVFFLDYTTSGINTIDNESFIYRITK